MAYYQGASARIFYYVHDRQDSIGTITLLHGLGSSGDDWLLQVPALRSRYRVLTLDLPGHGISTLDRRLPRISHFADDISNLIRSLGITTTHVLGLSMGGLVAQQIALDHPELVQSLILVNTFPRLSGWFTQYRLRALRRLPYLLRGDMEGAGVWIAEEILPGEGMDPIREIVAARIAANDRWSYARSLLAVARFDVRMRLPEIAAPTLVVSGLDDRMVPPSLKQELAARIPDARLATIEGSGHASPIDASEAFNRLMLNFLEENR
jgi:3-oxoadipate enol-lactonase